MANKRGYEADHANMFASTEEIHAAAEAAAAAAKASSDEKDAEILSHADEDLDAAAFSATEGSK